MTQQETVIEKIRKLLALSKSSNPHEAALAASKAQALMLQYNLELSHIETVKSKYVKEMVSQKSRLIWRKRLLAAIARFNFCQTVEYVGSGHCEIIGEPHNIAIVRTLYDYLETTVERLADEELAKHLNYDRVMSSRSVYRQKNTPGYKRTWKNNFYHGAIDVLLYRLDEQQKQSIAEQEQSATNEMKALIVVKDHELKEAMEKMYPNIKEVSRHSVTKDQPGWAAGVKAGYEIALNKQLETKEC